MSITDFIQQYYINPMVHGTGYNFVNSLTYAILFIFAIYSIFLLLKKLKISIDKRFVLAILPFVLFGSFTRVLEDAEIFKTYLLVTPFIYGIMIGLIVFSFLISFLIQKRFKIGYYKTMFFIGIFLLSFPLALLKFQNIYSILLVSAFFLPWVLISFFIKWKLENKLVTLAHVFDATTSFVAVNFFGFWELYPMSRFLTSINPFVYIIVKASVIVGILVLIDKSSEDKQFNNYLKLIIGILGLAPGLRNFLSLLVLG